VWGDLRVTLASIEAYAPGIEVVVGWNGDAKPERLPFAFDTPARVVKQPDGIASAGAAWNWCATLTGADEFIIMSDDVVLHPDSVQLLLDDVASCKKLFRVGFVGARSNYVKGPQNIRSSNGAKTVAIKFDSEDLILQSDMVAPICAWVSREAFESVGGFPDCDWFSDDVICWDMVQKGLRHLVSRAYVHHIGQRATGIAQGKNSETLLREGLEWVRNNRPDFAAAML
jgi:GT2 family glycosyltransferase